MLVMPVGGRVTILPPICKNSSFLYHSDARSDTICRGFASNAGLKYNTPEEFFLGQAPGQTNGTFNPKSYTEKGLNGPRMCLVSSNSALPSLS